MLSIKNAEFLPCFNYIEKCEEAHLYDFIQENIYKKNQKQMAKLKELGPEKYVDNLRKTLPKNKDHSEPNIRKNIKESMIENYVIRNKQSRTFLQELNIKIFLKIISNKNIIIENGEIIKINL